MNSLIQSIQAIEEEEPEETGWVLEDYNKNPEAGWEMEDDDEHASMLANRAAHVSSERDKVFSKLSPEPPKREIWQDYQGPHPWYEMQDMKLRHEADKASASGDTDKAVEIELELAKHFDNWQKEKDRTQWHYDDWKESGLSEEEYGEKQRQEWIRTHHPEAEGIGGQLSSAGRALIIESAADVFQGANLLWGGLIGIYDSARKSGLSNWLPGGGPELDNRGAQKVIDTWYASAAGIREQAAAWREAYNPVEKFTTEAVTGAAEMAAQVAIVGKTFGWKPYRNYMSFCTFADSYNAGRAQGLPEEKNLIQSFANAAATHAWTTAFVEAGRGGFAKAGDDFWGTLIGRGISESFEEIAEAATAVEIQSFAGMIDNPNEVLLDNIYQIAKVVPLATLGIEPGMAGRALARKPTKAAYAGLDWFSSKTQGSFLTDAAYAWQMREQTLTDMIGERAQTTLEGIEKAYPDITPLLDMDAGVAEGYTVREHTLKVLDGIQEELGIFSGGGRESDLSFMEVVAAMHDIGKGLAAKAGKKSDQHKYTLDVLEKKLSNILSPKDMQIARALVDNDILGDLLKGRTAYDKAYKSMQAQAQKAGLPVETFFRLQSALYKADAGAYPALRANIFQPSGRKLLVDNIEYNLLEEQIYGSSLDNPILKTGRRSLEGQGREGGSGEGSQVYLHGTAEVFEDFDIGRAAGENVVGPGIYLLAPDQGELALRYSARALRRVLKPFDLKTRAVLFQSDPAQLRKWLDAGKIKFSGDDSGQRARAIVEALADGTLGKHVVGFEFSPKNVLALGGGKVKLSQETRNKIANAVAYQNPGNSDAIKKHADIELGYSFYRAMSKDIGGDAALNKLLVDLGYDAIQFTHEKGGWKKPYDVLVAIDPKVATNIGKVQPRVDQPKKADVQSELPGEVDYLTRIASLPDNPTRTQFAEAIKGVPGLEGVATSARKRMYAVRRARQIKQAKETIEKNFPGFAADGYSSEAVNEMIKFHEARLSAEPFARKDESSKTIKGYKKAATKFARNIRHAVSEDPDILRKVHEYANNDPDKIADIVGAVDFFYDNDGATGKKWTSERVNRAVDYARDLRRQQDALDLNSKRGTAVNYAGLPPFNWEVAPPRRDVVPNSPAGPLNIDPNTKRYAENRFPEDIRIVDENGNYDPEGERRRQERSSLYDPSQPGALANWLEETLPSLVRTLEFIPNDPKFAHYKDMVQQIANKKSVARTRVYNLLRYIYDELGPKQHEIMSRYLELKAEERTRRIADAQGTGRVPSLRFGLESDTALAENIRRHKEYIDRHVPLINEAIERRRQMIMPVISEAVENGYLPETALEDPASYMHFQVALEDQHRPIIGAPIKQYRKGSHRSKTRSRTLNEEQYDPNVNLLESDASWLMETIQANLTMDAIKELQKYSRTQEAVAKAKLQRDQTGETYWYTTVLKEDPSFQGWAAYSTRKPGKLLHAPLLLHERIAESAIQDMYRKWNFTEDEITEAEVMADEATLLILPKEVVDQLNSMERKLPPTRWENVVRLWKKRVLMGPDRTLSYGLRNLVGDFEAMFTGNPGASKYLLQSTRELVSWYRGKTKFPSQTLQEAIDLNVLGSGFAGYEVGDISFEYLFKRFFKPERRLPAHKAAWRFLNETLQPFQTMHEIREGIMRYAAYIDYKKKLNDPAFRERILDGDSHVAPASRTEVLKTLLRKRGINETAAKMSRDLMGDYGNVSVLGQWMRAKLVPFWAFSELNARRYATISKNTIAQVIRTRGRQGKAGATIAAAGIFARMLALGALLKMWNDWVGLEDRLNKYEGTGFHITIPNPAEPEKPYVFKKVGAFHDVMRLVGLDHVVSHYPQYYDGTLSWSDWWDNLSHEHMESSSPLFQTASELFTGMTSGGYPVSPDEAVVDFFSVRPYWQSLKGFYTGGSAAPGTYERAITGGLNSRADLRSNDQGNMKDLGRLFMRNKYGTEYSGATTISEYRNMKYTAKPNMKDYKGFKQAFSIWHANHPGITFGEIEKRFKATISSIGRFVPKEKTREFYNQLSPRDKQIYVQAKDYTDEWEITFWTYLYKALREEANEN